MSENPWRNEREDIFDALEYLREIVFEDLDAGPIDPAAFSVQRTYMTLDEIADYEDVGAWLEAKRGELLAADEAEIRQWAYKLRAEHYDDVLRNGIPAVVVIDTPVFSGLADGRGRYNLAMALELDKLPVLLLTEKLARWRKELEA